MSIRKHTAYNVLGAMLPLGLSLFTIPIYIHLIGDERYGVLAVAWLLLGYFGLFDLGLGRATAQRIASLGDASLPQRASIFWTALTINVGLGITGGLAIWPVAAYFFGDVFSIDAMLRPELASAIPWLILAVPLATLSGVLTGALEGRSQFLELNIISVFGSGLIQLIPLAVAWLYGPDLAWLLPAAILARLVTLIVLFLRCRVHVFQGYAPTISRAQAKGLLQFGGWVTVTSVVGPMMVIFDRLVIGALLGAKAVTYYTVPFQLAERTALLPAAVSSALFPRLASAGKAEAQELATVAIRSMAVLLTPAMLLGVLLIEPFLRWWLSPEFASHSALTGQILLLGFWINGFARVPLAQLQAAGRPYLVALCHLLEVLPYLALLYMGLHFIGLQGAAIVFGLRTLVDFLLLAYFAGGLKQGTTALALPGLILAAGLAVSAGTVTGSLLWWTLVMTVLVFTMLWAWRNAPAEVRSVIGRACRGLQLFTR